MPCRSHWLEVVSQNELHDAGSREGFEAGNGSRATAGQIIYGQAAINVVQCVEVLPGKGQRLALGELERLAKFPIGFEESRTTQRIAAWIPFDEGVRRITQNGCDRHISARVELKAGGSSSVWISNLKSL